MAAERRLRHAEAFGGFRDAEIFSYGHEIAQVMKLHDAASIAVRAFEVIPFQYSYLFGMSNTLFQVLTVKHAGVRVRRVCPR